MNGQNGQEVIELPYSNSPSTPYVMYIGDKIAVASDSGSGFQVYNNYDNQLARTATGADSNYTFSDGRTGRKAEYFAQNVGTCSIHCGNEDIYIQVVEPPIMVKTEHEYKEKDRIREYLGPSEKYPTSFGLINQDGYVPNDINHPYLLNVGETMEIYSYGPTTQNDTIRSWKFWDACYNATYNQDGQAEYWVDEQHVYPELIPWDSPQIENYRSIRAVGYDQSAGTAETLETDAEGRVKHTISYEAIKPGLSCIHFHEARWENEPSGQNVDYGHDITIWVHVLDNPKFTHADMEIADGGTYSKTSTRYENGQKFTDVEIYNAYVSAVNSALIYAADGEQLSRFSSEDGDYEMIGQDGSTQYELSSAYICTINEDGLKTHKHFDSDKADHATFDVQLTLTPNKKYSLDENGQLVPGSISDLTGDTKIVDSAIFDLGHAAVQDAKNKCPLGNGLDFTVRAQSALLEVNADKTLTGRPAEDQEFTFEIFDPESGEVIATAKNDGEGHVVFENLRFDDAGDSGIKTYHYQMREVKPAEPDPHIQYTDQVFDVTVTVKRSMINIDGKNMEILYAEIDSDQPEFINHIQYTLPATGGGGIWIYLFAGIALMLSAIMLLCISSRRICLQRPNK